ncbi:MAG: VOC family protein [Oligoflexales bacterium]
MFSVHTILYVADQARSTDFYTALLAFPPSLNVPGMTEFRLTEGHILGIMPEGGIKSLLGETLPNPADGNGIPRAEIYFRSEDPESMFARAVNLGAKVLSPILERDWGERAGYVLDSDGHVLAFSS